MFRTTSDAGRCEVRCVYSSVVVPVPAWGHARLRLLCHNSTNLFYLLRLSVKNMNFATVEIPTPNYLHPHPFHILSAGPTTDRPGSSLLPGCFFLPFSSAWAGMNKYPPPPFIEKKRDERRSSGGPAVGFPRASKYSPLWFQMLLDNTGPSDRLMGYGMDVR